MKRIIATTIMVLCFLSGCTDNDEIQEGNSFSSPEEVIDTYFSKMDGGEFEGALSLFVSKNGTLAIDNDPNFSDRIEGLRSEFGENGELMEIISIEITNGNEWTEVENGSNIRLTELMVETEIIHNGTTITEEEEWTIIYFVEEDKWGILYCNDDEENDEPVEIVNLRGRIHADSDTVSLEIMEGSINWDAYLVTVDGISLSTSVKIGSVGDTTTFQDPLSNWDAEIGEWYIVRIVKRSNNMVIWESTIISSS